MRLFLLACILAGPVLAEPGHLPLSFGEHRLHVEYASSPDERQRGLMERTELAESAGMLFRFPALKRQCLWMKDTPLPLSAAFLDEQGRVINLIDLEPHDLQIKCSSAPARFAVETNQGWFDQRQIVPGVQVMGLPAAE
jgi:uncharacterized membrane protein (UPF0127 family)